VRELGIGFVPYSPLGRGLPDRPGALDVELSDGDLARLDELAPVGVAAGDRYPDMSSVNR